ncbi:bZIP transcription factor [Vombatid gammaherpesvirus 1]|uniref:BZIP transcription factor n=1 Tax=Vombatid gammaherpesvirus 1 TaxID=2052651 RepID=A0A3Q8J4C8_9GAMA|nr:bZIP transcription factor [Vombatid gammaherpesvirus 1]AZB49148.1 bZIP transcription factor [Vombatid gammaherpesvirus 1]
MKMLRYIKENQPGTDAIQDTKEMVDLLLREAANVSRYMQGFVSTFNLFNFWMLLKHLRNKNKPPGACHFIVANYSTLALRLKMEDILINTDKAFISSACLGIPMGSTIAEFMKTILIHIRRKCIRQSRPLGTSRDMIMNAAAGIMDEYCRQNSLGSLDHKTKVMLLLLFPPIRLQDEFKSLDDKEVDMEQNSDLESDELATGFRSTTKKRGLRNRSKTGDLPERFPDPILLSGKSTTHSDIYGTYCLKRSVELVLHMEETALKAGQPLPGVDAIMLHVQEQCVHGVGETAPTSRSTIAKRRCPDEPACPSPAKASRQTDQLLLEVDEESSDTPCCSNSIAPTIDIAQVFAETVGECEPYGESNGGVVSACHMSPPTHHQPPQNPTVPTSTPKPHTILPGNMSLTQRAMDNIFAQGQQPVLWEVIPAQNISPSDLHQILLPTHDPSHVTNQVFVHMTDPSASDQVTSTMSSPNEAGDVSVHDRPGPSQNTPKANLFQPWLTSSTERTTSAGVNAQCSSATTSSASASMERPSDYQGAPYSDPLTDLNATLERLKSEWDKESCPSPTVAQAPDSFPVPLSVIYQPNSGSSTPDLLCSFSLSDFMNKE